jgi:hypothetical protein
MTGRMVCAWCGRDLGFSGTVEDSHGVCVPCKELYLTPKGVRDGGVVGGGGAGGGADPGRVVARAAQR